MGKINKTHIILLALLALLALASQATAESGVSYAVDSRAYCTYSDDSDGTYDCGENESENSLFELDSEGRLFTHTMASMRSTYYIKTVRYDDAAEALIMDVVSDAGNRYTYMFYKYERKILVQGGGSGYGSWMLRFHVKSVF